MFYITSNKFLIEEPAWGRKELELQTALTDGSDSVLKESVRRHPAGTSVPKDLACSIAALVFSDFKLSNCLLLKAYSNRGDCDICE